MEGGDALAFRIVLDASRNRVRLSAKQFAFRKHVFATPALTVSIAVPFSDAVRRSLFHLERILSSCNRSVGRVAGRFGSDTRNPSDGSDGTDVAVSGGQTVPRTRSEVMSVVMVLSVMLVIGFVVTAIIGFLGWRQRMREGTGVGVRRCATPATAVRPRLDEAQRNDPEGARA
jgi:hypothetical protein